MKKKGQVWVETVIYTLIGVAVIGILLAVSIPKINEYKDKLAIEQTIESLDKINLKINEAKGVSGNVRTLDLKISNGKFVIDAAENELRWVLDSSYEYSESGINVGLGKLNILTEPGNPWKITLSVDCDCDLTYDGADELKEVGAASGFYSLSIESLGDSVDLRVG